MKGGPSASPIRCRSIPLASAEVTTPPPTPTQLGFAATSISQQENQTTLNLSVNRTGSTTGATAVHYETVGDTATVSITDDDTAAPSAGGSGGTGGSSSGSSSGGGGGAFDLTSLVALGLILAFSQLGMRRRSKRRTRTER